MRTSLLALCALLIAFTVSACGVGPDQSREDAHDVGHVNKTPPEVITFNNHYPNVETKCDGHGHRLFVTTHDSAVGRNVLVIDDPGCGSSPVADSDSGDDSTSDTERSSWG